MFKINDEVQIVKDNYGECPEVVGHFGTIIRVDDNTVEVEFDNDEWWADFSYTCDFDEIVKTGIING